MALPAQAIPLNSNGNDLSKIYLTADHDHLVFVHKVQHGASDKELLYSALQFARSAGRATGVAVKQYRMLVAEGDRVPPGYADEYRKSIVTKVDNILKSLRTYYAPHLVGRADALVESAEDKRRFKTKLGFFGVSGLGGYMSLLAAEQGDSTYTVTAIASTITAQFLVLMHNLYRDHRFDEFEGRNDARIKAMYNVRLMDTFIEGFHYAIPGGYEKAMCEVRLLPYSAAAHND